MGSDGTCIECGARLPGNAPQGLCPKCLLSMGMNLGSGEHSLEPGQSEIPNRKSEINRLRYFGDYELLEEIASGGMGIVYRARQVSLNRIVAVKMLLFGKFSKDEFINRFRAEAEAAASLQHPNIVAIHEVGEYDGQLYFSMDYVEGQTLSEMIREKPLPSKPAAACLKTLAEAIHYAHQQGILHRDLKPSNILIDANFQPHITDFGLAKKFIVPPLGGSAGNEPAKPGTTNPLTLTGQVLGSPNYMPPEQAGAQHGKIGPASDVYSLGAILYHALTGRPPFLAPTLEEALHQVLAAEPVAPRLLNPTIQRDLETICLKCLEKASERRYPSAKALAQDLDHFLEGESIYARRASSPERFWRWCQRRPAFAALLAFVLCAGMGSVLAAVQFNRLRVEANHSREAARLRGYVADMNLALQNQKEGNTAQALTLLRIYIPKPGEPDLRGFEWRYLWRLAHPKPFSSLPRHNQVLGAMQFSPDGKVLATFCWDNTLRLWSVPLGPALDSSRRSQKLFETNGVASLGAFSSDSRSYLLGTTNGSIYSCALPSGKTSLLKTNGGEVVACAADGRTVLTRDAQGILHVLDMEGGLIKFSLPQPIRQYLDFGFIGSAALSPDGKTLAVVQSSLVPLRHIDVAIKLWDVASGAELPLLVENRQIHCLLFSPDSKMLAVGDGSGMIRLWSIARQEFKVLEAYHRPVSALAFSPNGDRLATGSSAPLIKIWDTRTGTQEPKSVQGYIGQIHSLAFSPDGEFLAGGGRNLPVPILSFSSKEAREEELDVLSEHWGNFTFSPDGKRMAAGCKHDSVKVWNVEDFSLQAELKGASFVVAFTPNGQELLAANMAELPQWWNIASKTSRPVKPYPGGSMTNRITCVDLSTDRRTACLGHKNGQIELFDVETGQELAIWKGHDDEVRSVAFSPNGAQLVTGGRDRSVAIWDVASRRLLRMSPEHKGAICAVAFARNGKMFASGCGAGTIKLWDPRQANKSSVASISYHQDAVRALDFSPDGKTLASGCEDHTIKLWNIELRQEVASFQLNSPIRLVLFSPDGNTLAAVTTQGTLKVFRAISQTEADSVPGEDY